MTTMSPFESRDRGILDLSWKSPFIGRSKTWRDRGRTAQAGDERDRLVMAMRNGGRNLRPRRERPHLRAMLVEAQVSSMNTSFLGSRSGCPANQARRCFSNVGALLLLGVRGLFLYVIPWRSKNRQITEEEKRSPPLAISRSWISSSVRSGWRRLRPSRYSRWASIRCDRRSPPIGHGEISPVALKRATQRTALAMLHAKALGRRVARHRRPRPPPHNPFAKIVGKRHSRRLLCAGGNDESELDRFGNLEASVRSAAQHYVRAVADLIEAGLNEGAGRFAPATLWALCRARARFRRLGLPRGVSMTGLASYRPRARARTSWERAPVSCDERWDVGRAQVGSIASNRWRDGMGAKRDYRRDADGGAHEVSH